MNLRGTLLLPRPRSAALRPGSIDVRHGRIVSVRAARSAGSDRVILPGFIDAHLHLPQFNSIGQDGLPLLDWLRRIIFPAERRWADARFAASMSRRIAREIVSFGTTGVVAYATSHHASARAALAALGRAGLRGLVGQVLMDRPGAPGLARPAARVLAEAVRLAPASHGRMATILTPRFAVSCSEQLMQGVGLIAARTGSLIQTHLAETPEECRLVERIHKARYIQVYRRAGLLRPGSIFAHAVHLSNPDLRALARGRCLIAHCPTANLFLRSGAMDLARVRRAGVGVVLGSDVAGGPDRSMVRVARAMIETAKRFGRAVPSPAQAWHAITAGNADALGWADAGRIARGGQADLVVIRPTIDWRSAPDPLGALLYAWDDRWIERVFLAGRPAYTAR